MKISQKIHLVMLLSVALGVVLGLIFLVAQRNVEAASAQERTLSAIATSIFQLNLLGQDISLHPNELRAHSQWRKQHREIGDLLGKIRLDDPKDSAVLERVSHAHENQTELFDKLREVTRQQRETGNTKIISDQQERLIYRMSFGAQSMLSDALSLERRKLNEITEYRRKVDGIALSLAVAMTLAIALLAYLIGRSIIKPLVQLRRETEIIGSGNLKHRIGAITNDELGDLSRDFDHMVERLQQVTASREDLQHEIEMRIRTEQALRKSEQSLKKAQAIASMGSWELEIQTGHLVWSDEIYRIFGRQPGLFAPTYEAFLEAVHADDRPLVAQSVEQALQQGKSYDIEHRIQLPNGEVRVVHEIAEVEFDKSGKPVNMLGTVHDLSGKPVKMIGTTHDITERKRAEDALHAANARLGAQLLEIEKLQATLREQAIRDPLTGLFNRRYMEETLEREFSGAGREGYPVSIIMMDIDHFKSINDTYGHQAGDLVLQALSELLSGHIRGRDIACRYGGEEFLAVLPHTTFETAAQRAEQWRTAFESLQIKHDGNEIRATISLGVAAYSIHGKTGPEVLSAADKALYAAKQRGRNQVVVAP